MNKETLTQLLVQEDFLSEVKVLLVGDYNREELNNLRIVSTNKLTGSISTRNYKRRVRRYRSCNNRRNIASYGFSFGGEDYTIYGLDEKVINHLNKSSIFNMFGIVNIGAVKGITECKIEDSLFKFMVKDRFDHEMMDGVSFK